MTASSYAVKNSIKYPPLTRFDIKDVIDANADNGFNQALVKINDTMLRLGVWEGEFPFHKHDEEDELFYVVEGNLLLDVGDETHALGPGQGFVVPKGVIHRTRASSKVVVLIAASAGVVPADG